MTNVEGITENLRKNNDQLTAILGNAEKITDDFVDLKSIFIYQNQNQYKNNAAPKTDDFAFFPETKKSESVQNFSPNTNSNVSISKSKNRSVLIDENLNI